MAQNKSFKLGGIGSPCCCAPGACNWTICVTGCGGNLVGVTVQVKSGSTVVVSGTTTSGGCVTLNVVTPASYTVVVSSSGGFTTNTSTHTATCGGTVTIALGTPPAGADNCCGPCPLGPTLFLTDPNTTVTLTWNASTSNWQGSYILALGAGVCAATGGTSNWIITCPSSGNIKISYTFRCAGTETYSLTRLWVVVALDSFNNCGGTFSCSPLGDCYYWDNSSTGSCLSSNPSECGGTTAAVAPSACSPFSWTTSFTGICAPGGSQICNVGPGTVDPAAGSVTVVS